MPLPIPQLDDRRFKELVTTLRDQIPGYTKEWTDFNPSDPAITILELWCWLAEMVLYRINQIPQRTYTNFHKLVLDPPEPVTAEVTLEFFPQMSATPLEIPPGIKFYSNIASPPNLIFETFTTTQIPVITPVSVPEFGSPPKNNSVTFPVRSKVVEENNELLGISNGRPDQIFYLKKGPVLLDEHNLGAGYNPNPQITVDGVLWQYVPDFLEATTGQNSPHFMVEQLTGGVRFGNGVRGMIPPENAEIRAIRYQIIQGKEVRIGRDTLILMDQIPDLSDSEIVLPVKNEPAEGGAYIYPPEEMGSTGLRLFREKFRAITKEDFEELASTQFNKAQESDWIPEGPSNRVARAVAVPGKNLEGTTASFPDQPGVVSVIILRKPVNSDDVVLQPTEELTKNVRRFLYRRSLITTRIYVVGPDYVNISLDIEVDREPRTNLDQVRDDIDKRIRQFYHPLKGGDQENGWPMGRPVFKSELFQLVESVEGVDHVVRIAMNGNSSLSTIPMNEKQLPHIVTINIIS